MLLICHSSLFFPDPCVPQNLAATVNCDMKVVSLSWDASNGTNVYMVSGEAGNETTVLTTNVTTAHFSGFSCGLNYSLTVTPQNQHCPGNSSASASIQTCMFTKYTFTFKEIRLKTKYNKSVLKQVKHV